MTKHELYVIVLLLCSACAAPQFEEQSDGFENVPVVKNAVDASVAKFTIATKPTVHTGARNDSKLEQELWNVVDAVITTENNLIVSMSSGTEIRQFDSTGTFVRTIGRVGEGPGEFRRANYLVLAADSLRVFDQSLGRINTFNERGALTGITNIVAPQVHSFLGTMCCFRDGAYLAATRSHRRGRRNWYGTRDMIDLHFVEAGNSFAGAKRIASVEQDDASVIVPDMPVIYASGLPSNRTIRQNTRAPLARVSIVRIIDDHVIYGMPDAFQYLVLSKDGEPVRRVSANFESVAVTAVVWNAERNTWSSRHNEREVQMAMVRTFDRIRHRPPTLPSFLEILGEESGRVWVRRNTGERDAEQAWICFDRSGSLLGTLALPAAHRVVRFSNDHVIVRHKDDESGFAAISAFRISR